MNQSAVQKIETTILTQEQLTPAKDPLSWSGPIERGMVKSKIERVSPTARSRKEKDVWDAIKKEEERENRVAAATHVLIEKADKWGRKATLHTVLTVTAEVSKLSDKEKKLISEANLAHDKLEESVRAVAKRAMAAIQNKLVKDLATLESDKDADMYRIRVATKPLYDEAATRLEDTKGDIRNRVANFVTDIGELKLDQLEVLLTDKPVIIVHGGVERTIAVPGTHKKERALVGEG
jgi:hypothetical protein